MKKQQIITWKLRSIFEKWAFVFILICFYCATEECLPVSYPVANIPEDKNGRWDPHCPGIYVFNKGLLAKRKTNIRRLQIELIYKKNFECDMYVRRKDYGMTQASTPKEQVDYRFLPFPLYHLRVPPPVNPVMLYKLHLLHSPVSKIKTCIR